MARKADGAVDAAPRGGQAAARDVAAEDAHAAPREEAGLAGEHGDGVDLLAGGAAGAPHAEPLARVRRGAQRGEDLVLVGAELVRLAEEVGLVDGDEIDGLLELGAAALVEAEELVVLAERRQPQGREAIAQPPLHDEPRLGAEDDVRSAR